MIEAFTGLPGQGKTYLMTKKAIQEMKKGRKVYANYPLEGSISYEDISEILTVRQGLVLIDEAGLLIPAQFWTRLPYQYLQAWRQHRKGGIDIWYTAQDLHDVGTSLRRVTQFVNDIQRIGPLMINRINNPRSKEKYGFTLHLLSKKIFKMYDTTHFIKAPEYLNEI